MVVEKAVEGSDSVDRLAKVASRFANLRCRSTTDRRGSVGEYAAARADVVLVKASRGARLDEVAAALT